MAKRYPDINDSVVENNKTKIFNSGLMLGLNYMSFFLKPIDQIESLGIEKVGANGNIGLDLGVVFNLRISSRFDLRFVPALIFGSRYIDFLEVDVEKFKTRQNLEMSMFECPLFLKYKFSHTMSD